MNDISQQFRKHGFDAEFKYISSQPDASYIGKLYVDRFGREREEMYIEDNSVWVPTFIDIFDLVEKRSIILSVPEKTILADEPIDLSTFSREIDVGISKLLGYLISRHSPVHGEALGEKKIEHLHCKGMRYIFPGHENIPSGAIEAWYSEYIFYLVFAKSVFGNIENVFQLFNIHLIEPNEDLFTVPADYKPATQIISSTCSIPQSEK